MPVTAQQHGRLPALWPIPSCLHANPAPQTLRPTHASMRTQIEAATILHSRLIDQNRFCNMLEALETQTDRDNVWHRITQMKKGTHVRA